MTGAVPLPICRVLMSIATAQFLAILPCYARLFANLFVNTENSNARCLKAWSKLVK
ncbi:hypothetical protein NIES37_40250 [Tolypothrix tenuis PCC 7101]|uniref:Uncharacterized protein n=1 Tax=Tolypothrix tenuis PCC 7101 TaxID=231146 RepID=A0A1Z4N331_9CYAN|nr:hypothetical protein [Aulosira sp. FACHB-113]BAZ00042.1 hypothetical protein NIES37_40250 [Tolypothrix tenuis PCC 7101]BAZ76037.1 hypothetical protein NIES50_46340 [Aulosira laxa NIES-50]